MKSVRYLFAPSIALLLWAGCANSAGTKQDSEASATEPLDSLKGLYVDDAVIAHSGMDEGYLYLKTGGTVHFRGYYVFKIDPRQVNVQISGPTIAIEASGQAKIRRDARFMDGSTEPTFQTLLLLNCESQSRAKDVLRVLNRLKQKSTPR